MFAMCLCSHAVFRAGQSSAGRLKRFTGKEALRSVDSAGYLEPILLSIGVFGDPSDPSRAPDRDRMLLV